MFNIADEEPIPLSIAVKLVPPARSGKRSHISTLVRWILTGAKAHDGTLVKLEALRLGNRWMTSRQALQRFAEALTPSLSNAAASPLPRSPAAHRRASEQADAELNKLDF